MKKILLLILVCIPLGLYSQHSYFKTATVTDYLLVEDSMYLAPRIGINIPVNIWGTEVNNLSINFSDASDRSAKFVFRPADGLSMRAYTGDDYTGDPAIVVVDSNLVKMAHYESGAIRSIKIDTTAMEVRDDVEGIGLQSYADYSSGLTSFPLAYTQKVYQDQHLGGQTLNSTVYSPGDDEHGDIITWDNESNQYVTTNVIPVEQAAGIMIVAMDTVLYSNTTVDTIVTLPVGAVIWDIQVCVITTFDGSGTDLLDVGIIGDADRYENDLDLAVTAPKFLGLANLADRMTATTHIIFQYADSGADASTGLATIYVHYSKH